MFTKDDFINFREQLEARHTNEAGQAIAVFFILGLLIGHYLI